MNMEASKKIKVKNEAIVKKFTVDGSETGTVELSKELSTYVPNKTLLAQYIRVYLANQREGNASTKTRAEVGGTTKKVYKQKGTGGARHGSKKAPIYKGGGVVGGPKPAEYRLQLSKKQRQGTLLSALAFQIHQGAVSVVENEIVKMAPKTKTIVSFLEKTKLNDSKVLFILPDAKAVGVIKSARNIPQIVTTYMGSLNAYDVLQAQNILVEAGAFEAMQKMYIK
jgi:large subunit ribosomal protein L4